MLSFTFNGVSSDTMKLLVDEAGVKRDLVMPINVVTQAVSGRDGVFFNRQDRGARIMEVPVLVNCADEAEVQTYLPQIASWLATDEPAPFIFSDNPTKAYYATLTSETFLDRLGHGRFTTLRFLVPDPYAYTPDAETIPLIAGYAGCSVGGTARTFPKIYVTLGAAASFLSVEHVQSGKTVLIGQKDEVDVTTVEPKTRVFSSDCSSTSGWTAGTHCHGGTVDGAMTSNGSSFGASSYGTPGNDWRGPSLHKHLDAQAQDFEAQFKFSFDCSSGQTGRLSFYCLNAANGVVATACIKDNSKSHRRATFEVWAGDSVNGTRFGVDTKDAWEKLSADDNRSGLITIARQGNRWTATMSRYNTTKKTYDAAKTYKWIDTIGTWSAAVDAVEVNSAKWQSLNDLHHQRISDVKIWKLNSISSTSQAPQNIFEAGIEICINMATGAVLYDGLPIMGYTDASSQFFGIDPGNNTIGLITNDGVAITDASMVYQERWI